MKETIPLGYSEYITDHQESGLFRNIILPKLKQKKRVNLYCSFSYFTPNYTGIFLINELTNLMKEGFHLYLVMWDINCQSHSRFKRILQQKHGSTPETIIQEKMDEVKALFKHFNAPMGKLHLYRASDVLKRFMKKQSPNLFIQFYYAMEKMELNGLVHHHKASHLIQMPMDMFFSNFFHELYPEDLHSKIEVSLIYEYQESISKEVKDIMYKHEITNSASPLFLTLPAHPYYLHNNAIPDWEMHKDAVVAHMLACKPTQTQIIQTYNVILKKQIKEFDLLDKDNTIKKYNWTEFISKHASVSLDNQQVSLAYNMHTYLQNVRTSLNVSTSPKVLHIKNTADAVKYSRLLSRKPILDILQAINGLKNATQIAKELKMAKSNMSTYLNLLKTHNLINIQDDGSIHRNISAINANFEVGMHG